MLFDFRSAGSVDDWMPVNDAVMGGVSSGRLEATAKGSAAFTGFVSLENNGGFASVRSRPREHDLVGYSGLALQIRGDGQQYKINLKTDSRADGMLYRAVFATRRNEWQTLQIPFEEFVPTLRGRFVRNAPCLDPSCVTSVGLMISDRQAGPFRLEIVRIGAYTDPDFPV